MTISDARFGELNLIVRRAISFKEMPQTGQDWINVFYFGFHQESLELVNDYTMMLQRGPLEHAAQMNK